MAKGTSARTEIHGYTRARFEGVRDAFAENSSHRHELGGGGCIYHQGEKVVDLWGGVRNRAIGAPWEEDAVVLVFWASKGLAAMTMALAAFNRNSVLYRSLISNPGTLVPLDEPTLYARDLGIPAGGDVGTARAIARAHSEFVTGGRQLEQRAETLRALLAPARPPHHGFYDERLHGKLQYSLGFMKPSANWPFGRAGPLARLAPAGRRTRRPLCHAAGEPNREWRRAGHGQVNGCRRAAPECGGCPSMSQYLALVAVEGQSEGGCNGRNCSYTQWAT